MTPVSAIGDLMVEREMVGEGDSEHGEVYIGPRLGYVKAQSNRR